MFYLLWQRIKFWTKSSNTWELKKYFDLWKKNLRHNFDFIFSKFHNKEKILKKKINFIILSNYKIFDRINRSLFQNLKKIIFFFFIKKYILKWIKIIKALKFYFHLKIHEFVHKGSVSLMAFYNFFEKSKFDFFRKILRNYIFSYFWRIFFMKLSKSTSISLLISISLKFLLKNTKLWNYYFLINYS